MKDKTRSSLEQHKMQGKKIIPPLKQVSNLNLTSWIDRFPECFWISYVFHVYIN